MAWPFGAPSEHAPHRESPQRYHDSDTTTRRRLFAVLAPRESKTKITLTTNHADERNTNSTIRAIGVIRGPELPGPVFVVQI